MDHGDVTSFPPSADYYRADTETGDYWPDRSEDGLFELLSDLYCTGNSFVTITPADDAAAWSASVTLLADGTYEIDRSDPRHGEHRRESATSPDDIARDLTIWLAARDYPDQPSTTPDTNW